MDLKLDCQSISDDTGSVAEEGAPERGGPQTSPSSSVTLCRAALASGVPTRAARGNRGSPPRPRQASQGQTASLLATASSLASPSWRGTAHGSASTAPTKRASAHTCTTRASRRQRGSIVTSNAHEHGKPSAVVMWRWTPCGDQCDCQPGRRRRSRPPRAPRPRRASSVSGSNELPLVRGFDAASPNAAAERPTPWVSIDVPSDQDQPVHSNATDRVTKRRTEWGLKSPSSRARPSQQIVDHHQPALRVDQRSVVGKSDASTARITPGT